MTSFTQSLLLLAHLAGVLVWVGGMFFAYFCLRPAAAAMLQPPERLPLWVATFRRFLAFSAVAVVVVLASGLLMLMRVGFAQAPLGWHVMLALGLVMALVFLVVYAGLYPRLAAHCAAAAWPAAGQVLNQIRRLVALNLVFGLGAVAAAVFAR